MKHNYGTVRIALLVVALLLGLCPVALAQEVVDDPEPVCVPMAEWLAGQMEVDCEILMGLHADGAGFGEIKMAWHIAQQAPEDSEVTWAELLEAHLAGEGWGERLFAYRLSPVLEVDPEILLALKQEGLGWGEISHAAAVAESLEMPFEDAAALFASGADWDEIREALGLEEGPPPWARGRGPAGEVEDDDEGDDPEGDAVVAGAEDEKPAGPPAWAGTPGGPEKDKAPGGQGRGQSQGRGRP